MHKLIMLAVAGLLSLEFGAQSAWAEPSTHCVKATKVSKVISGKIKHVFTGGWTDSHCTSVSATHEGKFEKLASFSESEEAQLKALLKYVKVQASGVAGKPTVQFSGANVQVVNGEGRTASKNGTGNFVIGYDENPEGKLEQTGSHDLILGEEQTFTSFGGIVAGAKNAIIAEFASVTGGRFNCGCGVDASVSGGRSNQPSGKDASISGGSGNTAKGEGASVSGGDLNAADGLLAWAGGGEVNTAATILDSVTGGSKNTADGGRSSISGGAENTASGQYSSITGGVSNRATAKFGSVSGGCDNTAGPFRVEVACVEQAESVSGGAHNTASGAWSSVSGGDLNSAEASLSSIFGGKGLKATTEFEAIP
jgi:hypothetical protein